MDRRVSFSDESVRAILRADRPKVVTRRLLSQARAKIAAGDRLQVLEVHAFPRHVDRETAAQIARSAVGLAGYDGPWAPTWYRADGAYNNAIPLAEANGAPWGGCGRWRPGRYLPGWAVRTVLEVVSVQVERLHDILSQDMDEAIREGFANRTEFVAAWEKLNPGTWASNPDVLRLQFRRVER